jgi:hypothetical protein
MTACGVKLQGNKYYGMGLGIVKRSDNIIYDHSGSTMSFLSQLVIYPDLNLGLFYAVNTNDIECLGPFGQFCNALENFLIYDVYDGVDNSISFYVHFTYDLMFLFIAENSSLFFLFILSEDSYLFLFDSKYISLFSIIILFTLKFFLFSSDSLSLLI